MAKIDLHIHSTSSNDGQFTPIELVDLCKQAGLTHAAIADHNSVSAIEQALNASLGCNLQIIPALELDCTFLETNLHLLGYGINYHDKVFEEIEASVLAQEQQASSQRVQAIRELGIALDEDLLASLAIKGVVPGEMIAEAALSYDTANTNPILDPYRKPGPRSDNPFVNFYWDFFSKGKPAYVPMAFMSLQEAVQVIKQTGGASVLAHPGVNLKENAFLLKQIIAAGIQGLEVYTSYHNTQQTHLYWQAAQEHHLLMTCGSDFHGKTKPAIKIGSVDCQDNEHAILQGLRNHGVVIDLSLLNQTKHKIG